MEKRSKFNYWLGATTIITLTIVYILYNLLLLYVNMLLRLSIYVYNFMKEGLVERIYWWGITCKIRAFMGYCIGIIIYIYIMISYCYRDRRN